MKPSGPPGARYLLDHRPVLPEAGGKIIGHFEPGEIRPTGKAPVLVWWGRPVAAVLRWGWSNSWNSQPVLQTRIENAPEQPNFQTAFAARRCVVLLSAWIEARQIDGRKTLHRFTAGDGTPFGIAGLWAEDVSDKADHRFLLLNQPANGLFLPVAQRMPVILPRAVWSDWINPGTAGPLELLGPETSDWRAC